MQMMVIVMIVMVAGLLTMNETMIVAASVSVCTDAQTAHSAHSTLSAYPSAVTDTAIMFVIVVMVVIIIVIVVVVGVGVGVGGQMCRRRRTLFVCVIVKVKGGDRGMMTRYGIDSIRVDAVAAIGHVGMIAVAAPRMVRGGPMLMSGTTYIVKLLLGRCVSVGHRTS